MGRYGLLVSDCDARNYCAHVGEQGYWTSSNAVNRMHVSAAPFQSRDLLIVGRRDPAVGYRNETTSRDLPIVVIIVKIDVLAEDKHGR